MRIGDRLAITLLTVAVGFSAQNALAQVKPGDLIGKDNAAKVQSLLSPGNFVLVQNGMQMKIVASDKLDWPPPFRAATEKYSAQVRLAADGSLDNYVAGQPFPLLDPNDPNVAIKVMWNFSYRPLYSDDLDLRLLQVITSAPGPSSSPLDSFTVGHFALYNNIGRIEVPPIPTDPDAARSGVRYRFGFYPFLEPSSMRGYGIIRFRYLNPKQEDNAWLFSPWSRRVRRQSAEFLSDTIKGMPSVGVTGGGAGRAGVGTITPPPPLVSTLDPDSLLGFAAKIEDFNYKFLGEKDMLASVHAQHSPEQACPFDGGRSICPEDWEMRHLYVVEVDAKPGSDLVIPRRILYIDGEGWFITASDQYDREGKLWKTIAAFQTYRDRPVPDARVAIYPYKRMFQLGLVDYDLQSGYSSVVYMPGPDSQERECWYIDMGSVENSFFSPQRLKDAGH